MRDALELLPEYLTGHLTLSLFALLFGVVVSVPVGILVTRVRSLGQVFVGAASVMQTVPSLALLALMVPLLALLGVRSIGFTPALIALCLYSVLPILQNTVIGLDGVDRALHEAARGVGMSGRQTLWRVELPLALPAIAAGVRTSAVWVIGTATLATPVGATSLGNYIFSGLQTRNFTFVCVGCVAAALLALAVDGLIRVFEAGVRRRRTMMRNLALGAFVPLYLYTGWSLVADARDGDERELTVGAKTFTEQYVLSAYLEGWIERETDRPARTLQSLGSTVLFEALRAGDVDLYVDYSGTIWATVLKREGAPPGREAVLTDVRRALPAEYGVVVAAALGFENNYCFAMRRDRAEELGVSSLRELAAASSKLTLAADYEFFARAEWTALKDAYGFRFRDELSMDAALMYAAVDERQVDVITAYTTNGELEALDLVVLKDDQGVIPPYDAIVLVNADLARSEPGLVDALARLEGTIDEAGMRALNYAVDGEGRLPAEVAGGMLGKD